MSKPRSDSKLLNLSPEAQERIYTWLTEGVEGNTSLEKVTEQIWLDLGVRTSKTAVGTFYQAVVMPRRIRGSAQSAEKIVAGAENSGLVLDAASRAVLQQRVFEIIASPHVDPKAVGDLMRASLEAQKLDLKREDLALQRDKFKAAIAKKIDLGLEELYAEIKGNKQALELFEKMCAIVKKGVEAA